MRDALASREKQRESNHNCLERGNVFFKKLLNSGDPADLKASLNDLELRLKHQECKLEELGPQIDAARQKLDFFVKDHAGKLREYLNEPENPNRLCDRDPASRTQRRRRQRL